MGCGFCLKPEGPPVGRAGKCMYARAHRRERARAHTHAHTPVDNLVFVEKLQPQHHTGRIKAAERGWYEGTGSPGKVGGSQKTPTSSTPPPQSPRNSRCGEAGCQAHTARGSENTSLWMCSIRSPPAEYSITKHTCSGVWKQPNRFTRKGCPALVTAAKIRFSHIRLGRAAGRGRGQRRQQLTTPDSRHSRVFNHQMFAQGP